MNIKKRNPSINSVLDVVLNNTGKTTEEFFDDETREYSIDRLSEAAARIKDAVFNSEKITVVADYDADGITSAAIMTLLFQTFGAAPTIRLPKRFSEGYGLSEKIIDEISSGLLITVDNGITAIDAVKKAKEKGLDVIIIDHHLGPDDGVLPEADIIIDPNAIENSATFSSYCGAGLSYKLACEMLGNNHPILKKMISFAAIGTVADVMPLIADNRNIVKEGIKSMVTKAGQTSGLYALLNECCLEKYLTAKNIGFKIGPILNAPGRLFDDGANKALKVLTFDGTNFEAQKLAQQLIALNEERKNLAKDGAALVEQNIKDNCLFGDCPMTIYQPGLPEGLVGIFAGKIAEKYGVPCIIVTDSEEEGILKGSARSVAGIHLKNLLDKNAHLLERYGGHAEAAGLSLRVENLEEFRYAIQEGVEIPEPVSSATEYDIEISSDNINETIDRLEEYGPFGEGNPEPIILVKDLSLYPVPQGDSEFSSFARSIGENKEHLKLMGNGIELIGFDMTQKFRDEMAPKKINVVGCLSKNAWHSKITNQLEITDFESAEKPIEKTAMANMLASMAASR